MQEVMGGCKVCGKRMLTDRSVLIHRTCDACKRKQRREANRKTTERRKAERWASKAALGVRRCEQCGDPIEDVVRLSRKFCGNTCRQAAFRERR